MDATREATRDRYTSAGKLTALAVKRKRKRGMYGDGFGLYLQVAEGGSKSWVLRFKINGKPRHFGLGTTHAVNLAQARIRAADARRLLLDGHDPIAARHAARAAARLANARTMTFDECAAAYIKARRPDGRTPSTPRSGRPR